MKNPQQAPESNPTQSGRPAGSPETPEAAEETKVQRTAASASDIFSQILGALIVLALPYWLFIWRNLPQGTQKRWLITGVVALLAVVILVVVLAFQVRALRRARNYIIVVFLVLAAAASVVLLADNDRALLFKVLAVIYFSFLPAWLYMQFVTTRGKTIWDEYVLNLYRLHMDAYQHLPEPPRHSLFSVAWTNATGAPDMSSEDARANIYRRKFEGVYGTVESLQEFRAENLFPVVLATCIIGAGWALVVGPATLQIPVIVPGVISLGEVQVPVGSLRFGFLGAYFYVLQMLVRRYFQNDLKTNAYVHVIMRIIIVSLLVWVLDGLFGGKSGEGMAALAFVVGVFPKVGWDAMVQVLKSPMKGVVPSLSQDYPLSDLDGLTIWYEARLLEEGIEDMENLATCNLVDAMLNTRIPIERLVDWVDQSLLYLHLGESNKTTRQEVRTMLRKYGIRTATDLQDALGGRADGGELAKLERLLNASDDKPSRLPVVLRTLEGEPNLLHVREWREFPSTFIEKRDEGLRNTAA